MGKRADTPLKPSPDSPPARPRQPLAPVDIAMLNAVFSGGYYIAYYNEDSLPQELRVRAQYRRTRRQEDALQLAVITRHMAEVKTHAIPAEEPEQRHTRHEQLLQELQTLINRSDLVQGTHHEHIKEEIAIARQQLLRGGSYDDTVLMQTLQEIAADQGLTLAGGSVASGRFVSDIQTPEEPAPAQEAKAEPAAAAMPTISDPLFPTESDVDFYSLHLIDRFSAYDISEIGGYRHLQSNFFVQALHKALLATDFIFRQEAGPAELQPS